MTFGKSSPLSVSPLAPPRATGAAREIVNSLGPLPNLHKRALISSLGLSEVVFEFITPSLPGQGGWREELTLYRCALPTSGCREQPLTSANLLAAPSCSPLKARPVPRCHVTCLALCCSTPPFLQATESPSLHPRGRQGPERRVRGTRSNTSALWWGSLGRRKGAASRSPPLPSPGPARARPHAALPEPLRPPRTGAPGKPPGRPGSGGRSCTWSPGDPPTPSAARCGQHVEPPALPGAAPRGAQSPAKPPPRAGMCPVRRLPCSCAEHGPERAPGLHSHGDVPGRSPPRRPGPHR